MPEASNGTGQLLKFRNCRLLRGHQIVIDDLWVRNGKILNPERLFYDEQTLADVNIDCNGLILAPGFIDVQINGAFGVDFSVDTDHLSADLQRVAKGLLEHGVTSFCPTVITSHPTLYRKILPQFKKTDGGPDGATILGLHLEGPFINKEKKGAHLVECIADIKNGLSTLLDIYGNLDNVAILTLAPELQGAYEVIRPLTERGITVSLGHSMANLSEGEKAVQQGARFITHLFNAMLPFHHRDPHLVGLLTSNKIPGGSTVFYGIISDGVHTHPAALRIAQRTHPNGLVIVTDAVPAMGLPAGVHHLGTQVVEVKNNRAVLAGTNTLCGSIATMNQCVQFFYNATECSKMEALEYASLHPAKLLGISHQKGTLDYGSDADFIILDDELTVKATYIAGQQVWKDPSLTLVAKEAK